MKINKILSGIFVLTLIIIPISSQAIGQLTSPIIIKDALRGLSYEEQLTIVNTEKTRVKLNLGAEGAIKDWTKFYFPNDLETPINDFELVAGQSIQITALFIIPDNTANGEYKGTVSVSKIASTDGKENESTAAVTQKIDRDVSIIINDKEIINFEASIIPESYDLPSGQAMKVRIIYDNRGNTSISPEIKVNIMTGDETNYSVIFPYPENTPAVKPHTIFEIKNIEIPTTNLDKGKHLLTLDFYNNDSLSLQKDFYFTIYDESKYKALIAGVVDNNKDQLPLLILFVVIIIATIIGTSLVNRRKRYVKILKTK